MLTNSSIRFPHALAPAFPRPATWSLAGTSTTRHVSRCRATVPTSARVVGYFGTMIGQEGNLHRWTAQCKKGPKGLQWKQESPNILPERPRVATPSGTLADSFAKVPKLHATECFSLSIRFRLHGEDVVLHRSTAFDTMKAHDHVCRLDCSGSVLRALLHKNAILGDHVALRPRTATSLHSCNCESCIKCP